MDTPLEVARRKIELGKEKLSEGGDELLGAVTQALRDLAREVAKESLLLLGAGTLLLLALVGALVSLTVYLQQGQGFELWQALLLVAALLLGAAVVLAAEFSRSTSRSAREEEGDDQRIRDERPLGSGIVPDSTEAPRAGVLSAAPSANGNGARRNGNSSREHLMQQARQDLQQGMRLIESAVANTFSLSRWYRARPYYFLGGTFMTAAAVGYLLQPSCAQRLASPLSPMKAPKPRDVGWRLGGRRKRTALQREEIKEQTLWSALAGALGSMALQQISRFAIDELSRRTFSRLPHFSAGRDRGRASFEPSAHFPARSVAVHTGPSSEPLSRVTEGPGSRVIEGPGAELPPF